MIGFYVHHHGAGHLSRTAAVLAHLQEPATVMTSAPVRPGIVPSRTELIALPDDRVEGAVDPTGNGSLHWAPVGSDVIKQRTRIMADWLVSPDARLLVCDVSVEAGLLARLCSVATVVVRSHGDRSDRAHRLALDLAVGLWAPYPQEMEDDSTPSSIRDRTFYGGLLSRSPDHLPSRGEARRSLAVDDDRRLLVIALGAGGHSFDPTLLDSIADHLPDWEVVLVGPGEARLDRSTVRVTGWIDDPMPWFRAADVVAGHAGANLVAEVAAADRPFICVPEVRPHDEQLHRALRLHATGAALLQHRWPAPEAWPDLVAEALLTGSALLHRWASNASAATAARWLELVHERAS